MEHLVVPDRLADTDNWMRMLPWLARPATMCGAPMYPNPHPCLIYSQKSS